MNAGTRVIAIRTDGHRIKFARVKDAAEFAGIRPSTMSVRIRMGTVDKMGYRYIIDESEAELTKGQMKYRTYRKGGEIREYKDDDVELEVEGNRIVHYEVRNLRVSITPCPFKEYPKPMVGSGQCVRCSSFRGRNKKTHEVACRRSYI